MKKNRQKNLSTESLASLEAITLRKLIINKLFIRGFS